MGAFILLNGFMENLAKDFASVWLAGIGALESYLFLSWERRTTQWWGRLIEAVKVIEAAGIEEEVPASDGTCDVVQREELESHTIMTLVSHAALWTYNNTLTLQE